MIEGRNRLKSDYLARPQMLNDLLEYVRSEGRVCPVPSGGMSFVKCLCRSEGEPVLDGIPRGP
jgi:hypothetical protein